MQAAPVQLSRKCLKASKGLAGAIVVNAGNANCATRTGDAVALATVKAAGKMLRLPPREVQPASTGVIGVELDAAKITSQLPRTGAHVWMGSAFDAVARRDHDDGSCAKTAFAEAKVKGGTIRVAGMTKGSGMIHPQMATTLGFVHNGRATFRWRRCERC